MPPVKGNSSRIISSLLFSFFLWTAFCLLPPSIASAATIEVDAATDDTLANLDQPGNGVCSLREAIQNANTDTASQDDCSAGSGADEITFNGVSSITLVDDISVITDIKIQGTVALSGGNATRIFTVGGSGFLRLVDVTLQNGRDASGGAILQNSTSSTVTCEGSTFENNTASANGGAISSDGTLDIDGCSFEANEAGDDGGAIYKGSGFPLTIFGSNFADNRAGTDPNGQTNGGAGGALFFTGGNVVANITGSRFNRNTADSGTGNSVNSGGGAIHNNAIMNITACVFAGNEVNGDEWHGGAVFNTSSGDLSVNYSHFGTSPLPLPAPFNSLTDPNMANGSAALGGALYAAGPTLILGTSFVGNSSANHGGAFASASASDNIIVANSTFSDNMAVNSGGAFYHLRDDALLTLINVTVANNSATQGGGVYNNGDGDNGGGTINDEILLQNTIISNNSGAMGANCGGGSVSAESFNSIVAPAGSGCADATPISESPMLGAPELTFSFPNIVTYTLQLQPGSSALGSGSSATCAAFPVLNLDQRGLPLGLRPQGDPACDVGAYESSLTAPEPTPTPTSTPTITPTATETSEPTATSTPTATEEATATQTATPTGTSDNSATATPTPTSTSTVTETATPTYTATVTPDNSPTSTPTTTATATASAEATSTTTATPTSTGNEQPTSTPTATATAEGTFTSTATPTPSATPDYSETPTPSPTVTPGPTLTPGECLDTFITAELEELGAVFQNQCRQASRLARKFARTACAKTSDDRRVLRSITRRTQALCSKGAMKIESIPIHLVTCQPGQCVLCDNLKTIESIRSDSSGLYRLSRRAARLRARCDTGGVCRRSASECRDSIRQRFRDNALDDRISRQAYQGTVQSTQKIPSQSFRCD